MNEEDFFPDYLWNARTGKLTMADTNKPFMCATNVTELVFDTLEDTKSYLKENNHTGRLGMKITTKVC